MHLSSFVGNKSFQTQKKILEIIPESTKVTFDPGILYANKGYAELEPILKKTNVLMPNSIELELLTGKTNYLEGAAFMIQQGIEIVAVKLGSGGSYVTNGNESYNVKPFAVKVIDTTGAGDAFGSGFVSGLAHTNEACTDGVCDVDNISYAIRLASANATSVIEAVGATPNILTKKEFETDKRWKSMDINIVKL